MEVTADTRVMEEAAVEEELPTSPRRTTPWTSPNGRRIGPSIANIGDPRSPGRRSGMTAHRRGKVLHRLAPVFALAAWGCLGSPELDTAPRRVAGLERHHEVSDARALDAIQQFFQDASDIVGGWTAHYGDDPSAILYVAITDDAAAARRIVAATRERVAAGATPYRDPAPVRLDPGSAYRMSGQEQIHYMFRLGSEVVWLSADPEIADQALADVLDGRDAPEGPEDPSG